MPKRLGPPTLKWIGMNSVVTSLDAAAAYVKCGVDEEEKDTVAKCYQRSPFRCLPATLAADIIGELKSRDLLQWHHLCLLVPHNLKTLELASCEIFLGQLDQLVEARLKSLQCLDLSESYISNDILCNLVKQIPEIQSLKLGGTSCDDDVLEAIGANCKQLLELNVTETQVSDKGVRALIGMSEDNQLVALNCPKLKKLYTKKVCLFVDTAFYILKYLPLLETWEYENLHVALQRLHDETAKAGGAPHPLPAFKFDTLSLDEGDCGKVTLENLGLAFKYCPSITSVHLAEVKIDDGHLAIISECSQLKDFRIVGYGMNITFECGILPILVASGKRLETLIFCMLPSLCVKSVAQHCPQLKELQIANIVSYETLTPHVSCLPFQNLSNFCVEGRMRPVDVEIPLADLRTILCNAQNLKRFLGYALSLITDEFFRDIFKVNKFHHLQGVSLEFCSQITMDTVMMFLLLDNELETLNVKGCSEISYIPREIIKRIITHENMDVHFD